MGLGPPLFSHARPHPGIPRPPPLRPRRGGLRLRLHRAEPLGLPHRLGQGPGPGPGPKARAPLRGPGELPRALHRFCGRPLPPKRREPHLLHPLLHGRKPGPGPPPRPRGGQGPQGGRLLPHGLPLPHGPLLRGHRDHLALAFAAPRRGERPPHPLRPAPLSFPWLATREQVLVFDWNRLPFYTALVVGLVLLYVAYAAYREGRGGGPSGAWPPPGCSSFGPSPSDGG